MTTAHSQFDQHLKDAGFSITKARQKVFTALSGSVPLTMRQLLDAVSDSCDRASIYRTVELLEKLGVVQRIHLGWKYKLELADAFHEHHHHLVCTKCGELRDLPGNEAVEAYLQQLASSQGYQMQSHLLEIQGLCQKCQTKHLY